MSAAAAAAAAAAEADINNSLPLKLRHKSHLGDKDAATALLALHQHIKQEPNVRMSPPWDGEGSSDERDSGISIDAGEWTATATHARKMVAERTAAAVVAVALSNNNNNSSSVAANNVVIGGGNEKEENIHLKSQIARLESEVATIKNMMILSTSAAQVVAAAAAAGAQ